MRCSDPVAVAQYVRMSTWPIMAGRSSLDSTRSLTSFNRASRISESASESKRRPFVR